MGLIAHRYPCKKFDINQQLRKKISQVNLYTQQFVEWLSQWPLYNKSFPHIEIENYGHCQLIEIKLEPRVSPCEGH